MKNIWDRFAPALIVVFIFFTASVSIWITMIFLTRPADSYLLVEMKFHYENQKILVAEVNTEILKTHYGTYCSKDLYQINFYGDRTDTPRIFYSYLMAPMGQWSTLQGKIPSSSGQKATYVSMTVPDPIPYSFSMTVFANKNARNEATERLRDYYRDRFEKLPCNNIAMKY